MCGIVGQISNEKFVITDTVNALKRLEYRGYDSVGVATMEGGIYKDIGHISPFMKILPSVATNAAICHTRWATHGKVTKENAHPHTSFDGSIFLVHNGIIENHKELRKKLSISGIEFVSKTDTEVIAHYIAYEIHNGSSIVDAIRSFMGVAQGTFAVLLLHKEEQRIYAFKRDSPLVLGILDDGFIVASDIYAFSDKSPKAVFFDDDEYAIISPDSYEFFSAKGPIQKQVTEVAWTGTVEKDASFEHHMIKEIHEQPVAARRLLASLEGEQSKNMNELATIARSIDRILFVAAGTSYHASLIGVYILNSIGVEAHTLIASEFHNYMLADERALVIAISQSGETMDVVKAVKHALSKGAKVASIVNVPYSTIQRLSDFSIEILAGQEICVASTKTYTNQVITLLRLAQLMGFETDLSTIPDDISKVIESSEAHVMELARTMKDTHDIYIIGRGISYPVSREVALKLKEISYIHAEGMMGGELKHGTIALIEEGVIVFAFIQGPDYDMLSNIEEVEVRGANVIMITDNPNFSPDFLLSLGTMSAFPIAATIIGQLFSYYIAKEKGLPIDKPRNLAKSVTVK
ncbi:MAG: glutamine--fructose-6-phosphate transaminase (isomerizing) [Candidatus Methanofastidiosia archaeon]